MSRSPFVRFAAQVALGDQAVKRLEAGHCPMCGCMDPAATIRDELSRKEFHITQLCQNCQDEVFAEPEEGSRNQESNLLVCWNLILPALKRQDLSLQWRENDV